MPAVRLDISQKAPRCASESPVPGRRRTVETVTTWGSITNQVLALRDHLVAERLTCGVLETTGDYWKPFYYLLVDAGFLVLLVNTRHVKSLPGPRPMSPMRPGWLGAHGLVRGSFVPPEPIRRLRDLTRARTAITRERSREAQRLEELGLQPRRTPIHRACSMDDGPCATPAQPPLADELRRHPRRGGVQRDSPAVAQWRTGAPTEHGVCEGARWLSSRMPVWFQLDQDNPRQCCRGRAIGRPCSGGARWFGSDAELRVSPEPLARSRFWAAASADLGAR